MAELGLIEKQAFEDIADAIRERGETEDSWLPSQMPDAIRAIPRDGSNVTMEDNPSGGVDLTVDGKTETLARFSEIENCSLLYEIV